MAKSRIPIGSYGHIAAKEMRPGLWRATANFRYADGSLRPVRKFEPTKAKAVNALKAKLDGMQAEHGPITLDTPMAVVSALYMTHVQESDKKDSTKEHYEYITRTIIVPTLGKNTVREVTPGRVYEWLLSLPASRPAARSVLTSMMELPILSGAIAANPVKAAPTMTGQATRKEGGLRKRRPRALNAVYLAAVQDCITAWENEVDKTGKRKHRTRPLRHVMMMQLALGSRINETLALRWYDIDLDAGIVYLDGALPPTKGAKHRVSTKSAASDRGIKVPDAIVAMLRERLATLPAGTEGSLAPVFPSEKGTFMHHQSIHKAWRQARDLSPDLDLSWVTPHALRRTAGTTVADALGILAGAKYVGHSGTRTFEKHYYDPGMVVQDATEQIEPLMDGW